MQTDIAELVKSLGTNPGGRLGEKMGIELLEFSPDRVVGRMPVTDNTQPYGLLHGGASCVLAETLGSVAAAAHAAPDRVAVGIELNATHHRSATGGHVTGVALPLHLGRTLATYEIEIVDDAERRVCSARLTCMLRDPR
ncbi:hotdog fold thioesterase [Spiractinospora alimapuensis]|uniref:PaaI family thioesterase n=1 Tax=Spiractinospora alimapuensis TaxID=2820884 RepID=UPI001F16D9DF|nr:hotdog fold thioesterase [Spiractinospora alimapuensis]QVQ53071.1 hotdog fold thioesterase [Spiractinospora alimapuensis]